MKILFIFLLMINFSLLADDTNDTQIDNDQLDSFEEEFEPKEDIESDPLHSYNVIMTKYNDIFYTKVFFPIADEYSSLVPKNGRLSISNFFENLKFPIRVVNNLAQLKFKNTLEESQRFLINSTIGIVGLFDIASSKFELKKHNEDFGQTLGYYGVGNGFHIVLPFIGPSNVRDSLSMLVDLQMDLPIHYLDDEEIITTQSLYYINDASFKSKEYESLKKDAIQLYPYLKNIYEQHRESEIKK